MTRADEAKVQWNTEKKHWQVVIQVGAEVIRRTCNDEQREAGDAELKAAALKTANDEGYALDEAHVSIVR